MKAIVSSEALRMLFSTLKSEERVCVEVRGTNLYIYPEDEAIRKIVGSLMIGLDFPK